MYVDTHNFSLEHEQQGPDELNKTVSDRRRAESILDNDTTNIADLVHRLSTQVGLDEAKDSLKTIGCRSCARWRLLMPQSWCSFVARCSYHVESGHPQNSELESAFEQRVWIVLASGPSWTCSRRVLIAHCLPRPPSQNDTTSCTQCSCRSLSPPTLAQVRLILWTFSLQSQLQEEMVAWRITKMQKLMKVY